MIDDIASRASAIKCLKWSIIATTVVTILFPIIDILIAGGMASAKGWSEGLTTFFRIEFSYVVSALVTTILTLLLHSLIMNEDHYLGINKDFTPWGLIAWFVYIICYFLYLKFCAVVIAGCLYLVLSVILVWLLLKYWIDEIPANDDSIIKGSSI